MSNLRDTIISLRTTLTISNKLNKIAKKQDRKVSSVVHRILVEKLKGRV